MCRISNSIQFRYFSSGIDFSMCRLQGILVFRRRYFPFEDIHNKKAEIFRGDRTLPPGRTVGPSLQITKLKLLRKRFTYITAHPESTALKTLISIVKCYRKIGKRKYCKCIYKLKSNNNKKNSSRANLDLFNRPTNYDGFRNICGRSPLTKGKKRAKNERQRKEGGIGKNERKKMNARGERRKREKEESVRLHVPSIPQALAYLEGEHTTGIATALQNQ